MSNKSILFLSALDFKEKSIQVLRKTPEAYAGNGWDVDYVVSRDNSSTGSYFYEKETNLAGVKTHRFYKPLTSLQDRINNHTIKTVISKIAGFIVVLKLAYLGNKIIRSKTIDVIYGYEIHGVLAVNLLALFGILRRVRIVSRFQGTFWYYYYCRKMYLKMLLNADHYLALYLPSDLCIMTNDGTQGDKALAVLGSHNLKNYRFWINGVDEQKLPQSAMGCLMQKLHAEDCEMIALTVCRLESWKRVDRGIKAIAALRDKYEVRNFRYFIVGDGPQKEQLEILAKTLRLSDNIVFAGAIHNEDVKKYLNIADIVISTYDSSNVGNPLLEAIRANKIIFTLNNGDTGKWIAHKVNGFIYDPKDEDSAISDMAKDIYSLLKNDTFKNVLVENVKKIEKEKLWTWRERMDSEIYEVEKLLLAR